MEKTTRKFFAYIRVSTAKQGEGVSLQEQRAAIESYAIRHDLRVVAWFEETVTAAKRGRPAFAKMMRRLKAGNAAGVIIHKIDRGARNLRDWADLGELIDRGIEVHFSHESLDLHTRGGRLSADIQAVVAADYIRNLREETRKGFYGRLKQGLYPLRAPVGYLDRGKGLPKLPDPPTSALVRRAFELYATRRHTLHTLRDELHHQGLRNKVGGDLSINGLSTLLNNPFYAGIIRLKRTGETFQGIHEPLISIELYNRVQAVLTGKTNTRIQTHDFLFRRLIRCADCGKSLIGERQKNHVYYRCHTRTCVASSVREEQIENAIRTAIAPIQLTNREYIELQGHLSELRHRVAKAQEDAAKAVTLNLDRIRERIGRLTDAYVDGNLDQDIFVERRESLLFEKQALEEHLRTASNDPNIVPDRIASFLDQTRRVYLTYTQASPHEKRSFLERATSNRVVDRKNVEVALSSPFRELADRSKQHDCPNTVLHKNSNHNVADKNPASRPYFRHGDRQNRPKTEECDPSRDRPRTLTEFFGFLVAWFDSPHDFELNMQLKKEKERKRLEAVEERRVRQHRQMLRNFKPR